MKVTLKQKFILFIFAFFGILIAFTSEAHASKCGCIAEPFSKQYQHYSEHFWGTKRQWTCVYHCSHPNGNIDIVGGHRKWYLGKDDGREGVCDGIPFTSTYSNYVGNFIWVPLEPDYFDPASSSAKNLSTWAKEACR